MSLSIQKGFWQDKVIADTKEKLRALYLKSPDIAESDRTCLLQYWSTYENLSALLGDRWKPFVEWFLDATPPATIARCMRSLKEDETIPLTDEQVELRQAQDNTHRKHWGKERRLRNSPERLSDNDRGASRG